MPLLSNISQVFVVLYMLKVQSTHCENFTMGQLLKLVILLKSILSLFLRSSQAKYVEGHLIVAEKWYFVARFCFLSEHGQFEYFVEYSKEYAVQNLLLYYDSESQWPAVYKSKKTCEEREAALNLNQNQIINLTESDFSSGCTTVNKNHHANGKNSMITCHNARRFHSARPRWWFLAVSHCNASNGLNIKYKFLMTNGSPGEVWKEHFSADEFYIIPLLATFFIMYLGILVATLGCSVELKSRQLLHSTYKLFTFSIISEELGIVLQCASYISYANNGIGLPSIKTLGRMFESSSEVSFLLLLLLLAKGYTVTRGRLRLASSIKLTIFMCAYVVTILGLYIFEQNIFDPGEVLYLYESPPGYGLMILRIAAWWIFEYSTLFTLKHYPEKSNFYYPFNVMGTLWFVAGPSFTLIANSLIDKWIRESVVCGVYHFIALTGHFLFLLLTVPNKANKNFPYHVRTSQIDVMEVAGTAGNNTLYKFGHHPYAPYTGSTTNANPSQIRSPDVPVDLFSIKHVTSSKITNPMNTSDNIQILLPRNLENCKNTETLTLPIQSQNEHDDLQKESPAIETDSIFTVDKFIAPSLRVKRTSSA